MGVSRPSNPACGFCHYARTLFMVTIVIPVLEDARAAGGLLDRLPPHPEVRIVLADGGADPALDRLAAPRPDVTLLRCPPGRGPQMNAGAAGSAEPWLLFLHADSRLPPGWLEALRACHASPALVGGWFRFRLDSEAWQARVLERLVALRVALTGLAYGDQGFFVRREVFAAMGGYRNVPLMEDVDFVRRLRRAGPVARLSLPLVTSARRWEREGWVRRSARNLTLLVAYAVGVSPVRLARWYGRPGAQGDTSAP